MNRLRNVVFAVAFLAAASSCAGTLLSDIKEAVRSRWSEMSERCGKVSKLRSESNELSKSILAAPVRKLKDVQISREIDKIREELLSTDARRILARVDEIDVKIEGLHGQLTKLAEEKEFFPERREKIDESMAKVRNELEALGTQRSAELEKVKKELGSIGLKMEGKAGDNLFSLVTKNEIINNVVVARTVSEIVTKLQAAMTGGDISSAKRYFGVYVIMTEINIKCLEDYLDKSRNGEWRKRLDALDLETRERITTTEKNSADERFNEKQRCAFKKNLEMSKTLLTAIGLYRQLLDSQEKVIEKRLVEMKKVFELAQDSYATVSAASDLISLMQSNQEDFAAILDMDVPELEVVPDLAVQEQLQSITKMLDR